MYNADLIAKYFLSLQEEDSGDLISNLKLQKLLYYAQGVHLALKGTPLFEDQIVAWMHGPVVESVYHTYKDYKSTPIPRPTDSEFMSQIKKDDQEFLDEVYKEFGQYSAWRLREMTHDEEPWKVAFKNGAPYIISPSSLLSFFKDRITVTE